MCLKEIFKYFFNFSFIQFGQKKCFVCFSFYSINIHANSHKEKLIETTIYEFNRIDKKMMEANFNKIIDGLFISDSYGAANISFLQRKEITHLMICATEIKIKFPNDFVYKKVNLIDSPKFEIFKYLDECVEFINSAILSGGKVLVLCNQGRSRSVSVVIAVLVKQLNFSFEEAYEDIKKNTRFLSRTKGLLNSLRSIQVSLQ